MKKSPTADPGNFPRRLTSLAALLLLCTHSSSALVVNVDVNTNGSATFSGQAGHADAGNNHWNSSQVSMNDLTASDGVTGTSIDVTISSGARFNAIGGNVPAGESHSELVGDYAYVGGGDITVDITGLGPNEPYRLYLYCQGDQLSQKATVTFPGNSPVSTTGRLDGTIAEGENYLVLDVSADNSGAISGTVARNGSNYVALNGMQIVELTEPRTFVHPGIGVSLEDLNTLKANLDVEPWKSAYEALASDGYSAPDFVTSGPFETVIHSKPGVAGGNGNQWAADMRAMHNLARMWYLTDDNAYGQRSYEILMSYVTTHTLFASGETYLEMGYTAWRVFEAAEILRGTWPAWTQADTEACKTYFENVWWNTGHNPLPGPLRSANQGAANLAAQVGVAIFNDDEEKFDLCLQAFRAGPAGALMDSLPNGQVGDSGRDVHSNGQIELLVWMAESFWIQGVDVYAEHEDRLLAVGEYYSRVAMGMETPFVTAGTVYDIYPKNNSLIPENQTYFAGPRGLNQLYGAYVLRKGMSAPYLEQYLSYFEQDSDSFHYLKSSDSSTATVPFPLTEPAPFASVTSLTGANMGDCTTGSETYNSGTWTVTGRGTNMYFNSDPDYHFAYLPVTGDATIIAQLTGISGGSTTDARAGLVFTESIGNSDTMAAVVVTAEDADDELQTWYRGYSASSHSADNHGKPNQPRPRMPYWLKIERIGERITLFSSPDGASWSTSGVADYAGLSNTAYFGLAVSSDEYNSTASATFTDVRITDGDGGEAVDVPEAPFAIYASPGETEVPLRWLESFEADSYKIWRSTTSGGPYTLLSQETGTSFVDTNIEQDIRYYYAVSAVNTAGESVLSPEDTFIYRPHYIEAEDYAANSGIRRVGGCADWCGGDKVGYINDGDWTRYDHVQIGSGSVFRARVANGQASATATGRIEIYLDAIDGTLIGSVDVPYTGSSNQNWETIETALSPVSGTHTVFLKYVETTAGGVTGNGLFDVNWFGIINANTAPDQLIASVASPSELDLSWSPVMGATDYILKRSLVSGGPYTDVANIPSTTFRDTWLSPDTQYYYVVAAVVDGQETDLSSEILGTVSARPFFANILTAGPGVAVDFDEYISSHGNAVWSHTNDYALAQDGSLNTVLQGGAVLDWVTTDDDTARSFLGTVHSNYLDTSWVARVAVEAPSSTQPHLYFGLGDPTPDESNSNQPQNGESIYVSWQSGNSGSKVSVNLNGSTVENTGVWQGDSGYDIYMIYDHVNRTVRFEIDNWNGGRFSDIDIVTNDISIDGFLTDTENMHIFFGANAKVTFRDFEVVETRTVTQFFANDLTDESIASVDFVEHVSSHANSDWSYTDDYALAQDGTLNTELKGGAVLDWVTTDDDTARSYLGTVLTNYGDKSWTARVGVEAPSSTQPTLFFGLGDPTPDEANNNEPQTDHSAYVFWQSGNSSSKIRVMRNGSIVQNTGAWQGDPGYDIYMDYNHLAKTVQFEIDNWNGGRFSDIDVSTNAISVDGFLTDANRMQIFFGANAKVTFRDFEVYETVLNAPPVANNASESVDEDASTAITLSGSDANGDPLTYAVTSQPVNGLLSGTAPNLTYTPDANYNGSDSFTFSVNDGSLDSAAATVSIAVNSVNDAPLADSMSTTVNEDDSVAISLSGSDIDGDSLSYAVASQPTNGSLSGTAPNLVYTPSTNYFGSDSFTYTAHDGTENSLAATVSITVNPVNDAPVADSKSASVNEDDSVGITLSGSDTEGSSLSYAVASGPSNGSLSGTAPNLTYTPSENYHGSDSFTYTVNDGTVNSTAATVSFTVNSVNDAPVFSLSAITGANATADSPYVGSLAGSASDADGDNLSYSLLSGPSWLSVSTNGTLSGTPASSDEGANSWSVQVADGNGGTDTAALNITVDAASDGDAISILIEAEDYTSMSGIQTEDSSEGTLNVGWTDEGDYCMYADVDLTGITDVSLRTASRTSGNTVEIRLGSATGTLIGTVSISNTGHWQTWTTDSAAIDSTNGVHDVYLVFATGGINLNWIEFTGTEVDSAPGIRVTEYYLSTGDFVGTEATVTLDQALADDYFILVRGSRDGNGLSMPNNDYARVTAVPSGAGEMATSGNASQIKLSRAVADFDWEGVITVVECANSMSASGFKLVDILSTGLSGTSGSDVSSTWSDVNQVVLFGGYRGGGASFVGTPSSRNHGTSVYTRLYPSGTNSLNWSRDAGGEMLHDAIMTTFVIEWGADWNVQYANVSGSNGGNGADAIGEYSTSGIGSVNRDHTWVWGTGTRADAGIGDSAEACLVTLGNGVDQNGSENTVAVGSEYTDAYNFDVYTMTHASLSVDHRFKADGDTGASDLPVTVDPAAASARFGWVYNGCNGTGDYFSRPRMWSRYTADDEVTLSRGFSGQNFPAWVQGVDFSGLND